MESVGRSECWENSVRCNNRVSARAKGKVGQDSSEASDVALLRDNANPEKTGSRTGCFRV